MYEAQVLATLVTLLAALVTALATVALWRATRVLAKETMKLADATAQPQVVASLIPNRWSLLHTDLTIENTGNASAFDISIEFDPPLTSGEAREELSVPFQHVSVLKPGQSLTSYLSEVGPYLDRQFVVRIEWARQPGAASREALSYVIDMGDYSGVSSLGERDPLVQIAKEVKHIRDDWRSVAAGNRRVEIDSFSSSDRDEAQRVREELRQRRRAESRSDEPPNA